MVFGRHHLALVLALVATFAVRGARAEDSAWHADLDVSYMRATQHFVSTGSFVPGVCDSCTPPTLRSRLLRGSVALGLAGLNVEASVARPVEGGDGGFTYTLGVRLDTSYRAHVSLAIRGAYLRRFGQLPGRGGRFGAALQIRIVEALVLYGEGGVDVTSVPQSMSDLGAIVSYSTYMDFGLRFGFAP